MIQHDTSPITAAIPLESNLSLLDQKEDTVQVWKQRQHHPNKHSKERVIQVHHVLVVVVVLHLWLDTPVCLMIMMKMMILHMILSNNLTVMMMTMMIVMNKLVVMKERVIVDTDEHVLCLCENIYVCVCVCMFPWHVIMIMCSQRNTHKTKGTNLHKCVCMCGAND